MKAYAMLELNKAGWIEKEDPACGPLDAICRPVALAPCTSDIHTVWEGAIGDRHNLVLGHEGVGEIIEVGALVKDFSPGDIVIMPAITPDWGSREAQRGYSVHSGGMRVRGKDPHQRGRRQSGSASQWNRFRNRLHAFGYDADGLPCLRDGEGHVR